MNELEGRVAIVTGAAGAIGKAVVAELAKAGVRVACVEPEGSPGLGCVVEEVRAAGGEATAAPADVTEPAQVERMVEGVVARWGEVGVLVNNAGLFQAIGAVWEVDPETWWRDVRVNLFGAFLCCRAVLPSMLRAGAGTIINIAGGGFGSPHPGASAYASSKAGLMRLTDTLAAELAWKGSKVRVHALMPALVRSALTEGVASVPAGREWLSAITEGLVAGNDVEPASIALSVLRLIAASSDALNGRILLHSDDAEALGARLGQGEVGGTDLFQLRYVRP
jgi:NAD(P)-dependent dehydrogenase (short-subunit alcohol dehydrogenase family)